MIDRICLVDIDADLVVRFLDWLELERRNSASTRNVRLAAIHAFFRYVQFQNPEMLLHCQRILAIPMKETEKRFVEYLPEQVLKDLLSIPDQTKKYGIRDTALLCLLYDSGARVQELIDLSLLDIRLETPATVRLYGKGRKVRVVPLMSQTAAILQKYLNMWHLDAVRRPDDPVFVNHQGKRLTRPGVTYILNKYMVQVSWMEGKKGVIPMYCSNCGALLYGYRNDEGKIKYECKRCGTVAVRVQKGRRHDKIDLYAPEGQIRYY